MRNPGPPSEPEAPPRAALRVDAVAALRAAGHAAEPDPAAMAVAARAGGIGAVVARLREDRKPVTERDVLALRACCPVLRVEIAPDPTLLELVLESAPDEVCFVAPIREEVTVEGGLDCAADADRVAAFARDLAAAGIAAFVAIEPDPRQIRAASKLGVAGVDLHAGRWSATRDAAHRAQAWSALCMAAAGARELGLAVHASRGIGAREAASLAAIPEISGISGGHAVVARSLLVGMERAAAEFAAAVRSSHALRAASPAAEPWEEYR